MKRLFLDDERKPIDCAGYMLPRLRDVREYHNEWEIVRNYDDFIGYIEHEGLPDLISFDHDLGFSKSDVDYDEGEKSGMSCAKWLVNYCMDNNLKLPKYFVHSMNPVGYLNIKNYLDNFQESEV